ncbi:MAG TPA: hypothetical protein VHB46_14375 [Burkholderiales bacterium]|nr:hypothetical protein [Burkholderiales bacterium]
MQTEVIGSQRTARLAALKGFGIGALVVGLIALMAVAAFRETAKPKQEQQVAAANTSSQQAERPAVTAEEEAYARALWPIHAEVKQDAVRMTFAGLAYKMGDIKRAAVKERVEPLTPKFVSALAQLNKLQPPASMARLHAQYREAIELYRDASVIMIRIAADGKDEHLFEAQAKTSKAADLTLEIGETLWPGEFKPN